MKKKKYNRFVDGFDLEPITAAEVTNPEFKAGYELGLSGKIVERADQSYLWRSGYVAGLKEYGEKLRAQLKKPS